MARTSTDKPQVTSSRHRARSRRSTHLTELLSQGHLGGRHGLSRAHRPAGSRTSRGKLLAPRASTTSGRQEHARQARGRRRRGQPASPIGPHRAGRPRDRATAIPPRRPGSCSSTSASTRTLPLGRRRSPRARSSMLPRFAPWRSCHRVTCSSAASPARCSDRCPAWPPHSIRPTRRSRRRSRPTATSSRPSRHHPKPIAFKK